MGDVGKKEEKESGLEKIIKEVIKEVWYGKSKEGGDKGRTAPKLVKIRIQTSR